MRLRLRSQKAVHMGILNKKQCNKVVKEVYSGLTDLILAQNEFTPKQVEYIVDAMHATDSLIDSLAGRTSKTYSQDSL
jgi:hypothetical protein